MSLFWNRSRILRVVAGEASLTDENKMRAHLTNCKECRGHYDELTTVAQAAAPHSDAPAARERARLWAALSDAPSPSIPRRRWAPWAVVPVLGAAMAAMVIGMRTPSDTEPEIAWRGGNQPVDQDSHGFALLLYTSKKEDGGKAGPLRLAGDFPKAGEATVSLNEYMQFGYRGLDKPAFVYVVGTNETGRVNLYVSGERVSSPTPKARPLGQSADTGSAHAPGKWRLYAIISENSLSPERIRAAIGKDGLLSPSLPGRHVQAILSVVP